MSETPGMVRVGSVWRERDKRFEQYVLVIAVPSPGYSGVPLLLLVTILPRRFNGIGKSWDTGGIYRTIVLHQSAIVLSYLTACPASIAIRV